MAIVAYYDYEIWKMDVKTTFLNGYLEEDMYMEHPEGFIKPDNLNNVCNMKKSIYGLKQVSRSGYHRFDENIKMFGFLESLDEPCVYIKASGSHTIFLILYVDDIFLIGKNIPTLRRLRLTLVSPFK